MNIFIILLMALFMAGYYFMDAPNVSVESDSKIEAIDTAELKSVLACVLRSHSDALILDESNGLDQKTAFSTAMPCAERYDIKTRKLCADDRKIVANCSSDKVNKSVSNYIITTTDIITENGAGKVLELLGQDYPYAANFGIISVVDKTPYILSSGGSKREISRLIAKEANFANGQLAYITQYAVSGRKNPVVANQLKKIRCNPGEMPIFRQNRWGCVASNIAPVCSGDFIWNSESAGCVPDTSKRPLCKSNQSAVMIGDIWECVDPEQKRVCPGGMTAQLNYDLMEWECVANVEAQVSEVKKCDKVYDKIYGGGTATLRGNLVSCNDCEKMIVHDDCTAECVPDISATASKACYAGECRNFYFGFPDPRYIANARKNMPELENVGIPLDDQHSRNRRFNCVECPLGIDTVASMPPYVIICR